MSLYTDRVAKGLCGSCGETSNTSQCPKCREKSRQRAANKRAKHTAAGLCNNCKQPVTSGSKCDRCKEIGKTSRAKTVAKKKAAGICVKCPNPVKPGCTLCQKCIDTLSDFSSKRYHERKAGGVSCYFCDNPRVPGKTLCEYHQQKYADYRFQLKLEVLEQYGGPVCVGCDSIEVEILEIDHIEGGGRKHFREEGITGGYSFYLWLKNHDYPAGYRVLCPTCNKKAHKKIPLPLET